SSLVSLVALGEELSVVAAWVLAALVEMPLVVASLEEVALAEMPLVEVALVEVPQVSDRCRARCKTSSSPSERSSARAMLHRRHAIPVHDFVSHAVGNFCTAA
ncbi:unnamed protein product, partial [Polarella glacialis]